MTMATNERHGLHTQRGVEVLGISGRTLGSYPYLTQSFGIVKAATARANGEASIIDSVRAQALVDAARELANGSLDPALFPADLLGGGGSIAIHMNVNEVLSAQANQALGRTSGAADAVDPKRHASASQSTADVCHTASRLAVLATAEFMIANLNRAIAGLIAVAEQFSTIPTLSRTCLRDGVVAPLSTIFSGSAEALIRRRDGLVETLKHLDTVVLGTTVIGLGTGAPTAYRDIVVELLAEESKRVVRLHPNPPSALQHGDDLVAVSGAIAQIGHPLLKLASDLRLLGAGPVGGFGEIVLPHVIDGSAFFSDKSNPVVPETIMHACLQVQGLNHTVQLSAERAELYLQVFDGLVVVNVLDALRLMTEALDRLDRFVLTDLRANAQRCADLSASATGPAT